MDKHQKAEQMIDRYIERAFADACPGVQIDIMDIPKVFAVGREAYAAGGGEAGMRVAIRDFVATIRKN
jgi:TPP-dependent pyruvate/acetoin dehydrogenase alpha subunit